MSTTQLVIDNFENVTDTAHLEKAFEAVPGVESVEIDPQSRKVLITHHGADPSQLASAAQKLGYRTSAD